VTSAASPGVVIRPADMTAWTEAARARGERVAFVPTMGFLHEGHLALMREGRRRADRLVVSIFVNPMQFGPKEDLAKYPRDREGDLAKIATVGAEAVFVPTAADMYPSGYQTFVRVRDLERGLCGDRRPDHFVGVATVVLKLFQIVRPHVAVFGEKDLQQLAVIRRMVADLNVPVEVVGLPTVREPDGLAMSSRNSYLGPADRARAVALSLAIGVARARAQAGEREGRALIDAARAVLEPRVDRIDYLEVRDAETLAPVETISAGQHVVMLVAAFVGPARLIDNGRL
jgi:pantoate--beta-alanine ligase